MKLFRYVVRPKRLLPGDKPVEGEKFVTLYKARHNVAFKNAYSAIMGSNMRFEIYDRKLKRVVS